MKDEKIEPDQDSKKVLNSKTSILQIYQFYLNLMREYKKKQSLLPSAPPSPKASPTTLPPPRASSAPPAVEPSSAPPPPADDSALEDEEDGNIDTWMEGFKGNPYDDDDFDTKIQALNKQRRALLSRLQSAEEEFRKNRAAGIPLKRTGIPDDVAKAVVFLASEEASYTTGEALNVSGGLVMH